MVQLITAVFSVYCLANMATLQEGPGGIFEKFRAVCGAYDYGPQSGPDGEPLPKSRLGRMVKCPYCLAPYIAAVFVPAALYGWDWLPVQLVLLIFGASGISYALLDLSR